MDSQTVITVLVWSFCVTGAALIATLVWLAKGVFGKLQSIEHASSSQFKQFGQQLSSLKDLLTDDMHRHDLRITRLEEWRLSREHERENERLRTLNND